MISHKALSMKVRQEVAYHMFNFTQKILEIYVMSQDILGWLEIYLCKL